MSTIAKDWHEMCLVKRKLDETMDKIDDMFIDVSDGCRFKRMYMSNPICNNEDHMNSGDIYGNAQCCLEECPVIADGIAVLDMDEAESGEKL